MHVLQPATHDARLRHRMAQDLCNVVVQVGNLGNRPQEDVLSRLQKKQKKAWKQEGGQTDERGEAHGGITRMRGPDAWRHGLCTHVMVGGWPKVCGGQETCRFYECVVWWMCAACITELLE